MYKWEIYGHEWIELSLFLAKDFIKINVDRLTWIVFSLLTTLHLFANYRAVRAVCMESLNQARLHIIMQDYFSYGTVPDVVTVNLREPVVMSEL